MENIIATVVLAAVLGLAAGYIHKSKKRGITCIGCPDAAICAKNKGEGSGCAGYSGNCASCSGCRH